MSRQSRYRRSIAVRHGFVSTRVGGVCHYLEFASEFGDPADPPVVCLHGVTGHAWMWCGVAERLCRRRRVIAVDLRGHGNSSWSRDERYSTADLTDDLEDVMAALGGGPADIVGASWGALVGLLYLTRHPQAVDSLSIVDMAPAFQQGESDVPPRPGTFATPDEVAALERTLYPFASAEMIDAMTHHGVNPCAEGFARMHDPYFLRRWPFRSEDHWAALPAVRCDTLLVHASQSFVPGEVMQRMRDTVDHGQLVQFADIPESGHMVPVDSPALLADLLIEFYSARPAGVGQSRTG